MTTTDKAAEREKLLKLLPRGQQMGSGVINNKRFELVMFSEQDMLDFAQQVLERERASRWIPVTEKTPDKEGWYVVDTADKGVIALYCLPQNGWFYSDLIMQGDLYEHAENIKAWQYLPEPMEGA